MRSGKDSFEEQYQDVLQNIEFALVSTYEEYPDMIDADAGNAISGLIRLYQAEQRGRNAPEIRLNPTAKQVSERVHGVCEWRLGRRVMGKDKEKVKSGDAKSVDEIVLCLKRIQKSIETWNRDGGRRGYYNFVSQFVG